MQLAHGFAVHRNGHKWVQRVLLKVKWSNYPPKDKEALLNTMQFFLTNLK